MPLIWRVIQTHTHTGQNHDAEEHGRKSWAETNTRKCGTMRMNARCERRVKIGEDEVEDVQKFVFLGAVVSNTGGTSEDMKSRLQKERLTYRRLRKVWGTANISVNTKVRLFKALVRSVLLHGSEALKIRRENPGCVLRASEDTGDKEAVWSNKRGDVSEGKHEQHQ